MKCSSSITCLSLALFSTAVLSETEECGRINATQFENHEKFTEIDEFPWMARIAYKKPESSKITFNCQAVLISQRHLITAAHCLGLDLDLEPYAVVFGDWNTKNNISEKDCDGERCSTPQLVEIAEMSLHPQFSTSKHENDIALITLAEAVTFTDYIRPICLPSKDVQDKDLAGKELMLIGWLRAEAADQRKRKQSVVMLKQQDCREKYAAIDRINITDALMCAFISAENEDIHMSGSALMDVKDELPTPRSAYLVGILAYGPVRNTKEKPEILIRIDRYLDWIEGSIQ